MRTVRNLNRASLAGIAIILSGILFSANLFAQQTERIPSKNLISKLFSGSTEQIIEAVTSSSESTNFRDEEIQLEDWMSDLDKWTTMMDTEYTVTEESGFKENEIALEGWMMELNWNVPADSLKDETADSLKDEKEILLEDWMNAPGNWN